MPKDENTPCAALFDMMKRYGGISYKELASLILSGKPLFDGISPASRIEDRSWLSRFVVHAPVGSIQASYFADFPSSALRVTSRLMAKKRKSLTSRQVLDMISGAQGEEMVAALKACHQDVALYQNILKRLSCESGFTVSERAEMAVLLLLVSGCTANVRQAASQVVDFAKSVYGAGMATPLVTPRSSLAASATEDPPERVAPTLALMRVVDGYLSGNPHWLNPSEVTEVGSLVLDDGSINDVEPDVSGRHLAVWRDEDGEWRAKGLGSKYGSVLISGTDHSETVIESPRSQLAKLDKDGCGAEGRVVGLRPGDELLLASNTRFMVLEGMPGE